MGNTFFLEREEELRGIERFLDSSNERRILLVSGEQGVGKSSMLRSFGIHNHYNQKTILVEFDRLKPKSADINQFIDQLTHIITTDEKNVGFKWKKLLSDNEVDFTVLSSRENEFHSLVDTPPTELRPLEKAALIRKACIELLRLYSFHGAHKILIVVDDIDHIDNSLNLLLGDILNDHNISRTKIVASCGDIEKSLEQLGIKRKAELYETQVLARLTPESTHCIIDQLIQIHHFEISTEHRDWIVNRSSGLPALISECFHYLKSNNHPINAQNIDESDLIGIRLRSLNDVEIDVLSILALYGKPIKHKDIVHLFPHHHSVLTDVIDKLTQLFIIEDADEKIFFKNDRVLARCRHLVTKQKINVMHDRIACFLFKKKENGKDGIEWKEIADHLVATQSNYIGSLTHHNIINIIEQAVIQADSQSEFGLMYLYTKFSVKFLRDDYWQDRQDTKTQLYLSCQRASYLNNDLKLMQECTLYLLDNIDHIEIRTTCYENAVDGYISKNKTKEAIDLAIQGLSELGISLNQNPKTLETLYNVLTVRRKLSSYKHDDVAALPTCDDITMKSVMRLLSKVAHSTYGNQRNLFSISCCYIIELTLSHGLVPESAYAVQMFCSGIISGYFKRLTLGRKISRIWTPFYTEETNYIYSARSHFLFDAFIDYHISPLVDNVKNLDHDVKKNIEVGAYEMAAFSAHVACFHALDTNEALLDVSLRIDSYLSRLGNITQQNADRWLCIIREFSTSILEETGVSDFKGSSFNIHKDLTPSVYQDDRASVFIAHHYATVKAYLCADYDKALFHAKRAEKYREHVVGTYGEYLSVFIATMVRTKKAIDGSYSKMRALVHIKRALLLFNSVCTQKSINLLHKKDMLEAASSFLLTKNQSKVQALLDLSTTAEIKGHLMDALIGYELTYDISQEKNQLEPLQKALSVSRTWGAKLIEARISKKIYAISNDNFNSAPAIPIGISNTILFECVDLIHSRNFSAQELPISILTKLNTLIESDGIWFDAKAHPDSEVLRQLQNEERPPSFDRVCINNLPWAESTIFPVISNENTFGYFVFDSDCINTPLNIKPLIISVTRTLAIKLQSNTIYSQLQATERNYDNLFSNSIDGIVLAKDNGDILHANRMFIDMLDIAHKNLIKENLYSILFSLARDQWQADSAQSMDLFSKGKSDNFKHQYHIKSSNKHSLVTLRKVNVNNETRIYGYVIDVSDQAEKELSDRQLIKQARYFSSALHEIKNPLTTILGIKESIHGKSDQQKLTLFDQQIGSLGKLSRSLNDLLSVSTILEGRFCVEYDSFNVRDALIESFHFYKSECEEKNIRIRVNCVPNLYVISDGDRITQFVSNLVHNAIKYANPKQITIDATIQRDRELYQLHLTVKDDGIGMEQSLAERIFDPFEQGEAISNTGYGLGMYIVRNIIIEMGGSISLSTDLHQGASFTIKIPVKPCEYKHIPHVAPRPQSEENYVRVPGKIVIVDDEEMILNFLKDLLQGAADNVITFSNTKDAFIYISHNLKTTSLVLTDFSIEPYSGMDFIRKLRDIKYTGKAIISSGHDKEQLNADLNQLNVKYMPKPIDIDDLMKYLSFSPRPQALPIPSE